MVVLSVLLAFGVLQMCHSRRLSDEIDNEISVAPASNEAYRGRGEWVRINESPKTLIKKSVGSYVELECEAVGSPPPTLQWFIGDKPMSQQQSFETNAISEVPSQALGRIRGRLVFNYLLPLHEGTFTCVAESGSKIATADATIRVTKKEDFEKNPNELWGKIVGAHHKPRISLWAPTYMDVMGTNVILPCRTFGNPKPALMWLDPEGQEIGETGGRVTALPDGSLSIHSLRWADMGVYTCKAINILDEDKVETFIYPMKQSK